MKTLTEVQHRCQLAADQVGRARRIQRGLGQDGRGALYIARSTMISALRELEELLEADPIPFEEEELAGV